MLSRASIGLRSSASQRTRAFTLIELMLVVAIIGISLAIGIPRLMHMRDHESLSGAVSDIVDVCNRARSQAVLRGAVTELYIAPQDGRFELRSGGGGESSSQQGGFPGESEPPKAPSDTGGLASSAHLSSRVAIRMLDVNFNEFKDMDEAHVHFYPNGTCDAFTLVLEGDGEWRTISLEEVTSLASVTNTSDMLLR
jgi:prepilin-type N-terminal cleavage/methylation domain-containing protein